MTSTRTAIKAFDENRQLFGNPSRDPEKYNLYTGLSVLAEGIVALESKVSRLEYEIQQLRREVK